MSKNKMLLRNTLIYFIGVVLSKMMVFLLLPMYTTKLSTYEFGYIDLVTTIISILVPILTICIFDSLYRFIIESNNNINEYITIGVVILGCGITISIVGYIIINNFYSITYGKLILLSLITNLMIGLWQSVARANNKSSVFSISGVINTIVLMFTNIILIIKFNFKGEALLISTILANIFSIMFIEFNIKIFRSFNVKYFNKQTLRQLIKYSIPLIPNTINWWIMSLSDRLIISTFLGVSFNGIYAVANKFQSIINIFNSVFHLSWQDVYLSNYKEEDSEEYYNSIFNSYLKLQFTFTALLILITRVAIMIILGSAYQSAYLYIPMLYIGGIFNSLSGFLGTVYQANKDTKAITYTSILGAIINIVINIVFIPKIGLHAAALSTMIAFIIMFIIRCIDVKKYINLQINFRGLTVGITVLSTSILIYYLDSLTVLIISIIISVILFIISNIKMIKIKLIKNR